MDVYVPTFAMLSSVLTALTALPVTFADLRERGVCGASRSRRSLPPGCSRHR